MERKTRDKTAKQNNKRHGAAQVSMLSCDAAAAISLEQTNVQRGVCATLPTNGGCKDARSAKIMIHMAQITHKKHTADTHTHRHSLRKTGQFKDRIEERRVG